MTSIITGNDLGLTNNPVTPRGTPSLGRPSQSDQVYVNSATGNLVIQAKDDYLATIGPDLSLIRTYNSLGLLSDDNQDNWRLSVHEKVYGLTGTVNVSGSTIKKTFGDGADIPYPYDPGRSLYVSNAGDGAHDTLSFSANQWTWTDGTPNVQEIYNSSGQLISVKDSDNNTNTYGYTGALLTSITDASGQTTTFTYSGNNLTQVSVSSSGQTQTLTRYSYNNNRVSKVTVDLPPSDNSITDGKVYTTTYTYVDATSKRVASITESDGSTISFTYDAQGRVATYTDGEGKVTTLAYTPATQNVPATANLIPTLPTSYTVLGSLTTPTIGWGTAATLQSNSTVTSPQVGYDQNGNAIAIWFNTASSSDLSYSRYDSATDT